jgi:hypothetical protein
MCIVTKEKKHAAIRCPYKAFPEVPVHGVSMFNSHHAAILAIEHVE